MEREKRLCLCSDAPVSELSLELLLLQVVLPALLEQGHTRQWLKRLVHAWTFTAGYVLYVGDTHTRTHTWQMRAMTLNCMQNVNVGFRRSSNTKDLKHGSQEKGLLLMERR